MDNTIKATNLQEEVDFLADVQPDFDLQLKPNKSCRNKLKLKQPNPWTTVELEAHQQIPPPPPNRALSDAELKEYVQGQRSENTVRKTKQVRKNK